MNDKQVSYLIKGIFDLGKSGSLAECQAIQKMLVRYISLEGLAETVEPDKVSVKLKPWVKGDASIIPLIKEVRTVTGLGLKEVKDLVEQGGVFPSKMDYNVAVKVKNTLEFLGASIDFIDGSEMLNVIYGN